MRHIYLLSAVSFLLHISGYVCVEIIGGKEAVPHSRPYMVFLKDGDRACGGALIKANWVITAAHCIFGNSTKAVLGAHSLTVNTNQQQIIKVRRAIKHPCFDWETKINDLQLLQLEKPAKLNKFVSILPLPNQEENVKPKAQCSTAGWGVTDPKNKKLSDVLREVNLTIVDNKVCSKAYSTAKPKETIISSMICAGPLKKRKDDTCQGDSGGPLICDKKFTGIVSFGPQNKCGDPKFPGVYTRLTSKYLTWVRDTTRGATF
ncbi:PREDICTED: granzyme A-like [Nanorana parkeri]|uniref:granzyme A-like n=1 Tax=Nanorana parkeri TaxID=125878 RepID=UPI000854F7E3|nr:PREDICTED: granzyme A-like [Nanorana parkeri]